MTRESEEKEKEARSNERCPLNAGFMSPFITPPDENVSPQANELEGVATLIPSPLILCYYSWNTVAGNSVAVSQASFPAVRA